MKIILINLIMLIALNMCYAQISDEQAKKIVVEMIKTFKSNSIPELKSFKLFENSINSTGDFLNCQDKWSKATNNYKNGYPKILRYKDSLDYTLKKLNYFIYINNKLKNKNFDFKNLQINEFKKTTKEDYFGGIEKQYFHDIYISLYNSFTFNKFTFKISILESNGILIFLNELKDLKKDFKENSSIEELINDSN